MRGETKREHRHTIETLAREAFAEHVLVEEGPGRWLCRRPGTSLYYFRVVTGPNFVLVVGEIGELVLHPYGNDGLAWLSGHLHMDYMLSKAHRKVRKFLVGDALAAVEELPQSEAKDELLELWDSCPPDEREFTQAWHDFLGDEMPNAWDLDSEMLWCAHALLWFVAALDAREKEKTT